MKKSVCGLEPDPHHQARDDVGQSLRGKPVALRTAQLKIRRCVNGGIFRNGANVIGGAHRCRESWGRSCGIMGWRASSVLKVGLSFVELGTTDHMRPKKVHIF